VPGAAFLSWLAAFLAPAQTFIVTRWPAIAVGTQFANTLVWLCAALHFSPALGRVLAARLHNVDREDLHASWWCLCGAVTVGYMARWLLAGHNSVLATPLLPMWAVLNLCMFGIGVGVIRTLKTRDAGGDDGDPRKATLLWFALVGSCIGLVLTTG
jgi:hypothetical protein